MIGHVLPGTAVDPYESLAPFYDAFTADHDYADWMGTLLALSAEHGCRGGVALDAACGTGKSTLPLAQAGWQVRGLDASAAMLERARVRLGSGVELRHADVRQLGSQPVSDLVTWIDDAANCMLDIAQLRLALQQLAGALRPRGLLMFDVNTTSGYEDSFGRSFTVTRDSLQFEWSGRLERSMQPGRLVEAALSVSSNGEVLDVSRHVQRHHSVADVEGALDSAGLQTLCLRGMTPDGRLHRTVDEGRQHKLIFVATRRSHDVMEEVNA